MGQGNLPVTYYLVILAAGFAGSFHCIGMCGGFACALGRDPRGGLRPSSATCSTMWAD